MNRNFKQAFALLLAGTFAITACEKNEEVLPLEAPQQAGSANYSSPNLIFEETMEGSNPFADAVKVQVGSWSHALNYVSNPVFAGSKSARFELRDSDPLVSSGTRAEAYIVRGTSENNLWYSFSAYFPKDGYAYDSENEVINQWQQSGTPATSLRIAKDRFYLQTGNTDSNRKKIDLGPVTKDSWQQFVIHIIHSYGSDGLIEIWRNGEKILTHKGGNMYDLDKLPNWKIGIYKAKWNNGTTDTDRRVVYYDNIRVGNKNATYAEMAAGGSTTSSTTTTTQPVTTSPVTTTTEPSTGSTSSQSVVSYTLVNASTNKDIMTLKNGATISLKAIGTDRINIRANTNPTSVGTVKMELRGGATRTRFDDAIPYALYGDDRNGNYYYWTPPVGSYTLSGTTYAGSKSNLGAATSSPYQISFTVTQ
jgi:hypothetical protein